MVWVIVVGIFWLLGLVFGSSDRQRESQEREERLRKLQKEEKRRTETRKKIEEESNRRTEAIWSLEEGREKLKEERKERDEERKRAYKKLLDASKGLQKTDLLEAPPNLDNVASVQAMEVVDVASSQGTDFLSALIEKKSDVTSRPRITVSSVFSAIDIGRSPELDLSEYSWGPTIKDARTDNTVKCPDTSFQLLLFDLDDTLIKTTDLSMFRGVANIGDQPNSYVQKLTDAFNASSNRLVYPENELLRVVREFNLQIGIITRAPKIYTQTVLHLAYPNIKWSTIVTYEDVTYAKPHPDGVLKAMSECRVNEPKNVIIVGDSVHDLAAAYRAGCWGVLDKYTWPSRYERHHYQAERDMVPDAITHGLGGLEQFLSKPECKLPILEAALFDSDSANTQALSVIKLGYFDGSFRGKPISINSLGRYFPSKGMTARASWHPLSQSILHHKDKMEFSSVWVSTVKSFLLDCEDVDFVTVIPAKKNRPKRLEAFLQQISQSMNSDVRMKFDTELFSYSVGARSHHVAGGDGSGLNRKERFQNVRDNLSLSGKRNVRGKHIVVIDDVVTTGASLIGARACLLSAGAKEITLVSLAKTISIRR